MQPQAEKFNALICAATGPCRDGEDGRFDAALYHQLGLTIRVPSITDHPEDIPISR